jgi:hypothetical protein
MGWSEYLLEFTDNCQKQMAEIEKIEHVHEAIEIVKASLRKNPYVFGVCPPLANLRYAKTSLYVREGLVVPPLVFYFTIEEDEKKVRLFSVKTDKGFGNLGF